MKFNIDTYTDADGEAVQPYFAAFMIEKGYARAQEPFKRDGHTQEFTFWMADRWRDFKTQRGIQMRRTSPEDHAAFKAWLEGRCLDHLCRHHVEGTLQHRPPILLQAAIDKCAR